MATTGDLITRLRNEFLDDAEGVDDGGSKWTDANIVSALNWAESFLCRRLHLLRDSTTAAVCALTIVKDQRDYAISPKIVRIERLKYPGVTTPLVYRSLEELDMLSSGWDDLAGTPSTYTLDMGEDLLTFNRQPEAADGTVKMIVSRLPLVPMSITAPTDSPELVNHDDDLCHGALFQLYGKDDHQTYDPARAGMWKKEFDEDISRIIRDRSEKRPYVPICRPEVW